MPKYLIVETSEERGGKVLRAIAYFVFFWIAALFWFGFFYYGSEPVGTERYCIDCENGK